jgi:prepilin-type N-terminal cleavage/methylation domain-containing protein
MKNSWRLLVDSLQKRIGSRFSPCSINYQLATINFCRGFTLIELLVTMAIMTLISGLILANHNKFGGSVLLQNLAYDVALTMREAQVYGIAVRRFGSTGFTAGYGVHLETGANNKTYWIFADASGTPNGKYDTGGGELVRAITIQRGYHIQQLCTTSGSVENCTASQLDVLFIRPAPDAWISRNGGNCYPDRTSCQDSARVVVASPQGATMSVKIYANGQISVEKTITGL